MNLKTLTVCCLLATLLSPLAQANNDPEHLIESCKELVGIYAKHDQQNLLAGMSTSLSEALRAGYCMGVVDEYRRHNLCGRNDWFSQAARVAEMPITFAKRTTVEALLAHSCEI